MKIGAIASVVLAVSLAGAAPAQASGALLRNVFHRIARGQPIRIVAFGSSSTQGIGASSPGNAYPARLEADLDRILTHENVVVVNRGVGGQDADDMLARLDQDAIALRPDLVIWQTGSNDPLRGVPLDRFKEETRDALLKIRAAGIDVMLLEPQWCAVFDRLPGSAAYRDAVREVGLELGVPVIKRSSLMKAWIRNRLLTNRQLFAPDGLHMADGGYALLAKDIAREILVDAGEPDMGLDRSATPKPTAVAPAT